MFSADIFLPCLCASNRVTSESEFLEIISIIHFTGVPLGSKMITLSFYPKQPVPAEFNIK